MRKFMFTICLAECFVRRAIIRFLNHGLSRINWFEKRRALHFRHPVKSDPPRAIRFRFPVLSKPRGQDGDLLQSLRQGQRAIFIANQNHRTVGGSAPQDEALGRSWRKIDGDRRTGFH
jgi:hypothetical protein